MTSQRQWFSFEGHMLHMPHLTARLALLRGLVCDTATFRITATTAREYLLFEIELAEIGTFIDHFQGVFASYD